MRHKYNPAQLGFQSTPPVKAATLTQHCLMIPLPVFQSTPPVKAATSAAFGSNTKATFQSTPPVKAATHGSFYCKQLGKISIHAAREGGDAPSLDI